MTDFTVLNAITKRAIKDFGSLTEADWETLQSPRTLLTLDKPIYCVIFILLFMRDYCLAFPPGSEPGSPGYTHDTFMRAKAFSKKHSVRLAEFWVSLTPDSVAIASTPLGSSIEEKEAFLIATKGMLALIKVSKAIGMTPEQTQRVLDERKV